MNINLRKNEYDALSKDISNYHEATLSGTQNVIKEINRLLEAGGDFNVDKTSANLRLLLTMLVSEVQRYLETIFEKTEGTIESMTAMINQADK